MLNPSFLERFEKYKESQNTALVCGDTALTYSQLHKQCLALASSLRKNRVGLVSTLPESYDIFNPKAAEHSPWVVIISERSVNAVVGIIATWMAGGTYVLIGSEAPDAYINGILEDTAAAVVLRNSDFYGLDDETGLPCPVSTLAYTFPQENEIACAVFTSGSTGKPKGAVLEHRTINEIIRWQTEYMKPSLWTTTAAYASFSFIAAIWELFFPLANGLALHILDENTRHDLFALENYIETHRVSYTFLPPNIAEVFTQTYKGNSLKYLRVAGGRLKSCGDPAGRYEIMYHFGMSENGGSVTFKPIREAMNGDIPIGRSWNRTRIDLIDGEIAVSGPSLFRGYLARREETQKRLVDGRFLSCDLARRNENEEFIHMGRKDWNVKIRDMNVNPMQVESVLGECAGVVDCCVTTQTLNKENILIGWVAGKVNEDSLKVELAALLPEYMIPLVFIFLDKLPRNLNGKVDRDTLIYTPPMNNVQLIMNNGQLTLESKIAGSFGRVLGRSAGENGNFLALGGDSLKFMRLQFEIAREFSVNIPYTVLFANPTPRKLADILKNYESVPSTKSRLAYSPIPPAPPMDSYPVSEPMRQMWLLWRTGQDCGKYTLTIKCRFTGEIDKARVRVCFEELVRRNAILRSRFTERSGDVFQVIEDSVKVLIDEGSGEGRREFDLSVTPLFDISLDITSNENTLSFRTHHIIADAMGMRTLMEDFWTLYGGAELQESAQVTDVTIWSLDRRGSTDEKYWQELFADGVPLLELPYDFPRPAKLQSFSMNTVFFNASEITKLTGYAATRGATLFQVFLTAYAMLFLKLSGESSVAIGVPFAGRDHPNMARSIGMFVRTLPVKLDIAGMNLNDALEHTLKRFLAVQERQDMSLERLTKIINCRRVAGRNPFYDVMINYIPLPRPLSDVCGLNPEILPGEYPGALFDLVLDLREEKDGISVVFNYADSLFLPETVQKWARMFKTSLILPEDVLLDVWKAVLETDSDDFFTAGGTSLAAIRIEAALFEKGWLLSAADIFQNPKLHDMAALMTQAAEIDWEAEA